MPKVMSMTWAEWQKSRAAKRANLARLGLDMPSRRETDHGTAGRRLRKAFAGQRMPKFSVICLAAGALAGATVFGGEPAAPEEASVFGGGGLRLLSREVSFTPNAVYPGWKGKATHSRTLVTNEAGLATFTLDMSRIGGRFDGTLRTKVREDGRLAARWTMTPSTNMWVEECCVRANFGVGIYGGGKVRIDGRDVPLAAEFAKGSKASVHYGVCSELVFFDGNGAQTMTLSFPKPRTVQIQDSRAFNCPWFELRLHTGHGHKAGVPAVIDFALSLPDGEEIELLPADKCIPRASAKWLPVKLPAAIAPGSAADFTAIRGSAGTPAGRYGRLKAKDGHFEFEGLPGVPQRFYGVNLCFNACYPERDEAERLATMLAACGYNAIRIHHYDRDLTTDGLTPKEGWLERMDALVDACIRHGLYITTDLYCSRSVTWRSVGVDAPGKVANYKLMAICHEGTQSNLIAFTRMFLGHRNVYTGRRNAEEPALALISIMNEGMIVRMRMPKKESVAYRVLAPVWRAWRTARQTAGEFADAPDELPADREPGNGKDAISRALRAFCAYAEAKYAARMRRLLREELGCTALMSSLNAGTPPPEYDDFRKAYFDYTDTHYYWDHPRFLPEGVPWGLPAAAGHDSANPLRHGNLGRRGGPVVAGQPLTVTEFHYCTPCRYRGMSGLFTGANAAYDGWGGAWRFGWGGEKKGIGAPQDQKISSWFQVCPDPVSLAGERAAAALFLRGDLAPGKATFGKGDGLAVDRAAGSFTVTTARTAGGFRERGVLSAGDLRVDFGTTDGTVWVSSLSDEPIATASRLLLTHLTDGVDEGTVFRDGRRIVVERWGRHPHLLRTGRAEVSLRLESARGRVYALDAEGTRRAEVPVRFSDGWLRFTVDVGCRTDDATFLYEIVQ